MGVYHFVSISPHVTERGRRKKKKSEIHSDDCVEDPPTEVNKKRCGKEHNSSPSFITLIQSSSPLT